MEQFERVIKLALKEGLKGVSLEKSPGCPSELELAGYLSRSLSKKRAHEVESHIAECPACLEDLILASKVSNQRPKTNSSGSGRFKGWLKKNVWLILAIMSFALSFVYSHYFVQFLVATLVLAGKWIFETVNARILIMIHDAWKKGGEKEVAKVLKRHNSRIKVE